MSDHKSLQPSNCAEKKQGTGGMTARQGIDRVRETPKAMPPGDHGQSHEG